LGLNGEAIVDASLYNRLHEENMEHFLDDSNYENFQVFYLDEELTLGIGIYDQEQIAIGAYNETGEGSISRCFSVRTTRSFSGVTICITTIENVPYVPVKTPRERQLNREGDFIKLTNKFGSIPVL